MDRYSNFIISLDLSALVVRAAFRCTCLCVQTMIWMYAQAMCHLYKLLSTQAPFQRRAVLIALHLRFFSRTFHITWILFTVIQRHTSRKKICIRFVQLNIVSPLCTRFFLSWIHIRFAFHALCALPANNFVTHIFPNAFVRFFSVCVWVHISICCEFQIKEFVDTFCQLFSLSLSLSAWRLSLFHFICNICFRSAARLPILHFIFHRHHRIDPISSEFRFFNASI